jgi:hypothetical protein
VNYSVDPSGAYVGANGDISSSLLNTTIVEDEFYPASFILDDLGTGEYNLTINASQFSAGDYDLSFVCHEPHYQDQLETITLRILDSWSTQVDLIEPPSFYPWNNIAYFVINYYCTEDPRTNRMLSGAAINLLNISIKSGQEIQPFIELGLADLAAGKWGYTDLVSDLSYGAGFYSVWFNTTYVDISESTAFYVSPTLEKDLYATYTYNPYVWIRPILTGLTATSDRVSIIPVKRIDFYLDQSSEITVIYNVSDSLSVLNGQLINGATVTLEIRNNSLTSELIKTGSFTAIDAVQNPGEYKYTLGADLLGNYTISITASKENYASSIATFDFIVDTKPITYILSENIRGTVFFTPQNIPVEISLNLTDVVHNLRLSDATIEVNFEGNTYYFYEDPSEAGIYKINFNGTMLAGVVPDQTYTVNLKISKTNYTTVEFSLSLDIGLPVDPLFGIPILYWIIIGTTIGVVIGAFGAVKYVQYSRIPAIIKDINAMKKKISKSKSIPESLVTDTYKLQLYSNIGSFWREIGLDLSEKMKLKKKLPEPEKEYPEVEAKPPEPEIEYPEVEAKPPEPEIEYPEVEEKPPEPEIEYPEVEEKPPEPEIEYPEVEEKPPEPEIEYPEVEEKPPEPEIEYPEVEEKPSEPEIEYPEVEEKPSEPEIEYPEVEEEPSEPEKEYPEDEEESSEPKRDYYENQGGGEEE